MNGHLWLTQVNSITNLLELKYSDFWKYVESILHVY